MLACQTHQVNDVIAYVQCVISRNLSWDTGMSLRKHRLNYIELLAIEQEFLPVPTYGY